MALTPEVPSKSNPTDQDVDAFVSNHTQLVAALSARVQKFATSGTGKNPTARIASNVQESDRASLSAALTYCGSDATTVSVARKGLALLDLAAKK